VSPLGAGTDPAGSPLPAAPGLRVPPRSAPHPPAERGAAGGSALSAPAAPSAPSSLRPHRVLGFSIIIIILEKALNGEI